MATTTRILLSTMTLAAVVLAGCNRALPTEPQGGITEVPAFTSPSPNGGSEAAAGSSRVHPARSSSRPSAPVVPLATPSQTDPVPPTPPPTDPIPPAAPPVANDCAGPCDGIFHIPANDEYMAAIYAARDRVRSAVASGELKSKSKVRDWNVVPAVEWKSCFFYVANGYWYDANGVRHVGGCAAGMTDYSRKTIVISTKDESRTIALVKWEAMNFYLSLIGRKDLCDKWR
ncbi:MAG: hypothetical protein WC538_17845 [Thermoanaerobaculia bacterium]|jgi:hypothetical protein